MIKMDIDFIWGMGTNQFTRRRDKRNLFEEMSIKDYDIVIPHDPEEAKEAALLIRWLTPTRTDDLLQKEKREGVRSPSTKKRKKSRI